MAQEAIVLMSRMAAVCLLVGVGCTQPGCVSATSKSAIERGILRGVQRVQPPGAPVEPQPLVGSPESVLRAARTEVREADDAVKAAGNEVARSAETARKEVAEKNLQFLTETFRSRYNEKLVADLERIEATREKENGFLARTQAALLFAPTFDVVQPALVESFSLRNLVQALAPPYDPADIRAAVRHDLLNYLRNPAEYPQGTSPDDARPGDLVSSTTETESLLAASRSLLQTDPNLRRVIEDEIAQERLSELPWITRLDIFSLDVGIAHPEITIGVEDDDSKFRRKVDVDVPEFLFGFGIHFGGLSASFGTMVYRKETDGALGNAFYAAVNVDVYKATLNLTGAGNGS